MKAVFITYNQAYNEQIIELLEDLGQMGFTRWTEVGGRGTSTGEPHMGSHAWPVLNHALITMVEDDKLQAVMEELHKCDEANSDLGLRAFAWNIESTI